MAVGMTVTQHEPLNLLVTGGAGFIASHVAELLFQKYPKYKIVILDCLEPCASLQNFTKMKGKPNFKFIKGDIRSIDLLNFIVETEKIDTIMHFAAQTHVDLSFGNSITFTEANVLGTHMMLEVARAHKEQIKRFIHVSTDEVYGENASYDCANDLKKEDMSMLDPTNPYAASKAGAEMLVRSYSHSYGLPVIITRGNNVYGPRQFPEKLIPKMIMMVTKGKKLTVHGDGSSKRSYLHVDDVARAFDVILHQGITGKTYNIGTPIEHTVNSVVRQIVALMKPGSDPESMIQQVRNRPFNDARYYLDTSQLQKLGWKETVPFEKGLKETVDWYMKNAATFWSDSEIDAILVAHPTAVTGPPACKEASPMKRVAPAAVNESASKKAKKVKFLVFGRSGWIGGDLGRILEKQGTDYQFATARLDNAADVERDIIHSGCTHVLNAAGLTGRPNVDWCETHRKEVIKVNVLGTLGLADICATHGVHMTNFATGCIFHYDEKRPMHPARDKNLVCTEDASKTFTEEDRPNFSGSYYSETKGYVENMLREYDNVLTLRVRMPIDNNVVTNKRNFIYKISHYERVVDIPNSMTVLDELLPYGIELAVRGRAGIYNFCNPGAISHAQVLQLYKDYMDPDFTWKIFSLEEQAKILEAGRSNNELSPAKLWAEFPDMLPIVDSLKKYVFIPAQTEKSKAAMKANGK
mmetsp:Transcript_38583/g.62245  ORF Transcript_38583/g.62245 Transcript_38583/m.62245 type:complete len:695 (-) Transcript_38583:392-2476(-)|eukprot:CAMPEP_0115080144 /NCGR_PEP_ID=MMETSP0227-20121206/18514_1 /TAXON_ID=89957 /ORGANISM="Polarella glacialis, Strain CCMP 1383" /LENGTH=694 /DNA_ID=CAMNT_0002467753 /DNA_START=43 /DNA_END=2127 /DNA_ORIENTATION=+